MGIYQSIFEQSPDALLVVDHQGRIRRVNDQAERMFRYARDELQGQPVETLVPQRFSSQHSSHRRGYVAGPRPRPMGAGLKLFGRRKDESEFPVDIMLSPIETEEVPLVLCVVRDITERKQAEKLLDSLREKEVLLKEIHHRVKNNLAVISSLFYLQSTYTRDSSTMRILQESQDRVRSMALVHENLYRSENLAAVDFADYARTLSEQLVRNHGSPSRRVRLATHLESVSLSIELAVPCGLILNELMTNALLHAFPDDSDGEIEVSLSQPGDGSCVLQVRDAGIGVPPDLDLEHAPSLGLRLIRSLTRQIDGRFELLPDHPGTRARLTLRLEP